VGSLLPAVVIVALLAFFAYTIKKGCDRD